MSLILGVHLAKKLYLVSDTRATVKYSSGEIKYFDDLIKAFNINERILALEAGYATPAAFILRRLKQEVGPNGTIEELRNVINQKLKEIISKYVNETNSHEGDVALIFAGYNPSRNKKVESSSLGNAMSAPLVARGDGSMMNQKIHRDITNSLAKAIDAKGGLKKGDMVELDNTPDSEMFTVRVDIRSGTFSVNIIECFQSAIFYPKQSVIQIDLPQDIISFLEFGERNFKDTEEMLYQDTEQLISFVNRESKKHGFNTVGGHIFPLLVTPVGHIFPTGDLATLREGKIVKIGAVYVDQEGSLCYKLEDGSEGKYRHVESLDQTNLDLMELMV